MLFRLWDHQYNEWFKGQYGGSKTEGKVFSKIHSAKQALLPYFLVNFKEPYPKTEEEQVVWREQFKKHYVQRRSLWESMKNESIDILFDGRFEIKELN